MPAARALGPAQAQRFLAAQARLQQGDHAGALRLARALAAEAPQAADAHLLLAMCLAEAGDGSGAHASFERASMLAPGSEVVALNHAAWLVRDGRADEALRLLAGVPASARTTLYAGSLHLRLGRHRDACTAFRHALAFDGRLARAWHGLGSALQALDELEAAEDALAQATSIAPETAAAWVNRGAVLRRLGRLGAARDCLLRAQLLGQDTPEVRNALLGLLADQGQPAEALAAARALVDRDPGFVGGHESLAHLLWEHGELLDPGKDPLAPLRAAARAQPGNQPLQLACVRALLEAGRSADALEWLQPLRQASPGHPALDWLAADALDQLGRHADAGALYAGVATRGGDSRVDFLNARARHAFRTGATDLARACAERATRLDPLDQEAWSLLGTAWRLAGDAREDWLFGYERLVAEIPVELPPDPNGDRGFLHALETTLDGLHLASREPRAQSVRGGTQTPGRLFGRDDPVIHATARALKATVDGWLSTLPADPRHPFLARRQSGIRFVGSWSVRLRSAGHHANHIHDEGWLSSAFYVALPPSMDCPGMDAGAGGPGWLQLGQPMASLGLDLPPRRLVRPRAGTLVLFPSYLWHGTLPFDDPQPRVTVAFDMQPSS